MNLKKADDEIVRLVRKHVTECGNTYEEEPNEPFPQDCCGQSCKPCVFDIHFDDVVRWAKEYSKLIKHEDKTLYEHVFDDSEPTNESKDWFSSEFRPLELAHIENLNDHTVLVKLKTPQPILIPIASHIRIRLNLNDHYISRQYTPTRVEKEFFEVPIKVYKDGQLSAQVRHWQVGDMIECRGPYTEEEDWKNASHLLIAAAGTGIAPFVRIVDHLLSEDNSNSALRRICLLYCVRTVDDVIFANQLTEWAQSWNARVTLVLSKHAPDEMAPKNLPYLVKFEAGRLSQEIMEKHLKQLRTSDENITVAVCGPTTFEKDAINFAIKAGVMTIIRFHS